MHPTLRPVVCSALALLAGFEVAAGTAGTLPLELAIQPSRSRGSVGEHIPAELCLTSVGREALDLCLAGVPGYGFSGRGRYTEVLTLPPEGEPECVCREPLSLDPGWPHCFRIDVRVHDVGLGDVGLMGHAFVIPGRHEEGDVADRCERIDSGTVDFVIEPGSPEDAESPR